MIKKVLVKKQEVEFETFKDRCSTYLSMPMSIQKTGLSSVKIIHDANSRNG